MTILWPGFLALLAVPVVLLAAYAWRLRRRRPLALRYSSLSLVRAAVPRSTRLRRHMPVALLALALAGLVLAMSRPAVVVSVPASRTTILLSIDVSGSMCSTDIPPTRLVAAEQAAAAFIRRQAGRSRIGIVAFGGFAELVQAPTTDEELLLDAIHSLTTGRRTAIGSGLLASIDAIASIDSSVAPSDLGSGTGPTATPVPAGAFAPDIVVLLTDGVSNTGPEPADVAQQAAARGIRVYTIGFGTADGAPFSAVCAPQFVGREPFQGGQGGQGGGPFGGGGGGFGGGGTGGFRRGIDEATLQHVADLTGGRYYAAESADQLQAVFDNLPTSLITKHEVTEISVVFVAIAAACSAAAILLGQAWRPLP